MNFQLRSSESEFLDQPGISLADIRQNMKELEIINSRLGGHRITKCGLKELVNIHKPQTLHVCEIGCGGGDNLVAVQKWCRSKNIPVKLTGIDLLPECIEVAKEKFANSEAELICSDYKLVQLNPKPDIVFNSLFCHHFQQSDLIDIVHWCDQNSRLGFFINDLHRHPLAYYSIKWLTAVFSRSYLVKNDAPVSVLRGFSAKELKTLMSKAGILYYQLKWKWAFRWLLIVPKSTASIISNS